MLVDSKFYAFTQPLDPLVGACGIFISARGAADTDRSQVVTTGNNFHATIHHNQAIYVVDGVQVADISFVNPCEMASIDILKDGGAAIYGSQAANGVVVIETKGHRQQQSLENN